MGVVVLMANQNSLTSASHTVKTIMLLETLQSGQDRGVFLGLCLLRAECVVRQRIQADGLRLLCGEVLGEDGPRVIVSACFRTPKLRHQAALSNGDLRNTALKGFP
jgi:hypothetical protein